MSIEKKLLSIIDKRNLRNIDKEGFQSFNAEELEAIADECSKVAKEIAIYFIEWSYTNAKLYPDGWSYKGNSYSTSELFKIFIEQYK